jgi:radical SAM-linked protein
MARQQPAQRSRQPQPSGPAPLPAVQRLTVRYAKRGRMRFASHRDIARAVERGVRRAGLPVAHSAGFSPHPKISYLGGAPTGAASEAEYLEISLTECLDPAVVRAGLDAALPDGIDVIEVADLAVVVSPRPEASDWQVMLPGVSRVAAASAAEAFLAAEHAEVDRLTSNGVRRLDTRAAVVSLEVGQRAAADGGQDCATLRMVVRHLTPAVRPEDILVALRRLSALEPSSPPVVTRLAQFPLASDQHGTDAAIGPERAGITAAALRPGRRGAEQGQKVAMRPDAETADEASTAPASARKQLPCGAERPAEAHCAREPDERDRPDARDRATEQRAS